MKIDEDYFRALLRQTIEEDPLCCRGVFLLCGLEFTNQVPSLCVTLGRRSVLRVNLDFVNSHCRTEQHVQALLLHEFLHILLGHTLRFKTMTPAWNIALDAVINAIIHRRMGKAFSSMMSDYYVTAIGPVRLLRPMSEEERKSWILLGKKEAKSAAEIEDEHFFKLHHDVESGKLVSDDIIDVVRQFSERELEKLLEDGLLLLGGHSDRGDPVESLPERVRERLRQALSSINPAGIWRKDNPVREQLTPARVRASGIPSGWSEQTRQILRRLLVPDSRSRRVAQEHPVCKMPVLTPSDRRAALQSLWSPVLPSFDWESGSSRTKNSVQVYLDVSGSMGANLQWLVALLVGFSQWIRLPLWAFSSEVAPATIRNGKLLTTTTTATRMGCVLEHLSRSPVRKALVITDGFIENPGGEVKLPCTIEAIIPHDGHAAILESYGIPVSKLPPPPPTKIEFSRPTQAASRFSPALKFEFPTPGQQ